MIIAIQDKITEILNIMQDALAKMFLVKLSDVEPLSVCSSMLIIFTMTPLFLIFIIAIIDLFQSEPPLMEGFIRVHPINNEKVEFQDINKQSIEDIVQKDDYSVIVFNDFSEPLKIKEKRAELV